MHQADRHYIDIYLITSPETRPALEAALSQNPYLTNPSLPRPEIISPKDLELTTGTAELFRFNEVQKAIKSDFIVLPCDIVCELNGSSLLETWMTMQAGLGGASSLGSYTHGVDKMLSAELSGRRGGLGVWYQTKDASEGGVGVKKEETDFIASTEVPAPIVPAPVGSLRSHIRDVKLAMPTAVLQDKMEEEQGLRVRHALLKKHGNIKMMTSHRDAHIYFFPYWVKDMIKRNGEFDNLSEDVVGWWAKSTWQDGLAEKLQLGETFGNNKNKTPSQSKHLDSMDTIDLASLSSTGYAKPPSPQNDSEYPSNISTPFASRVRLPLSPKAVDSQPPPPPQKPLNVPSILGYLHPAHPPASLIRRVDTVALLLNVSLALAKLPSTSDPSSTSGTGSAAISPFSHKDKLHSTTSLPPQLTLPATTNLVDANVTLFSKSTIKECVIASNCVLGGEKTGVRLNRCLLMDGAVVEAGAKLDGCVLGRRCKIGADCELRDCYVQEGFVVADGTKAKGEVLAAGVDESGFGDEYDDEDEDGEGDEGSYDEEDEDGEFEAEDAEDE